jgi:hypothetical protein
MFLLTVDLIDRPNIFLQEPSQGRGIPVEEVKKRFLED